MQRFAALSARAAATTATAWLTTARCDDEKRVFTIFLDVDGVLNRVDDPSEERVDATMLMRVRQLAEWLAESQRQDPNRQWRLTNRQLTNRQ